MLTIPREQILTLMDELAEAGFSFRLNAWKCHSGSDEIHKPRAEWTGGIGYSLSADTQLLRAGDFLRLSEIAARYGLECWTSGSFEHPSGDERPSIVVALGTHADYDPQFMSDK